MTGFEEIEQIITRKKAVRLPDRFRGYKRKVEKLREQEKEDWRIERTREGASSRGGREGEENEGEKRKKEGKKKNAAPIGKTGW